MQNNYIYLVISSSQMRLHVVRDLSNTLKNVELKTLCMPVTATPTCFNVLNLSQCIICINKSNLSIVLACPN